MTDETFELAIFMLRCFFFLSTWGAKGDPSEKISKEFEQKFAENRVWTPSFKNLASFLNKYLKIWSHANQNFSSKYFVSSIKQNNY